MASVFDTIIDSLHNNNGINPIFTSTTFQLALANTGVNPEAYFTILRGLVIDYGFGVNVAINILQYVSGLTVPEAKRYLRQFIFTVGRKLNYTSSLQPLSQQELLDLIFVNYPLDFGAVIKTPQATTGKYILWGLLSYRDIDQILPAYSSAIDGTILLGRMKNRTIYRDALKMIISDRQDKVHKAVDVAKKVRTVAKSSIDRLFRDYEQTSDDGMYDVPEWTPLMLSRRESRIKWVIFSALRNWRSKMISNKTLELWEAGYIHLDYDPVSGDYGTGHMFTETMLSTWIREQVLFMYDTNILKPAYSHCFNKVTSFVHTRYPVTIDEIVYYLYEALDIMWSGEYINNHSKRQYLDHLNGLISRYYIPESWRYVKTWIEINGIMQLTVVNSYEDLKENTMKAFHAATDKSFKDALSVIFTFVETTFDSNGKRQLVLSDNDFLKELESYLELLAMTMLYNNVTNVNIATDLATIGVVQMLISNKADVAERADFNGWDQVKIDGATVYPSIIDNFVPNVLVKVLAYGSVNNRADISALNSVANSLAAIGLNNTATVPIAIDIDYLLSNIQPKLPVGAKPAEEIGNGTEIFLKYLNRAMAPGNIHFPISYNNLPGLVQESERKLDIFFSRDEINRSAQLYSSEEQEIVDTILQIDSLNISEDLKGSLSMKNIVPREVLFRHGMPEKIEIIPTVEFSPIKTPLYRFRTYFQTHAELEAGTPRRQIEEVILPSHTHTMSAMLSGTDVGYVTCEVSAMIDRATEVATGSMPQVIVDRLFRCVRTGQEFKSYRDGYRVFATIGIDGRKAVVKKSCNLHMPAVWSDSSLILSVSKVDDSVLDAADVLKNAYDLFSYCFTLEKIGKYDHKKMWYNANNIDTDGITSAVFVEVNPRKRVLEYNQANVKTELEVTEYALKTKLKVFKKLCMFNQYNKTLEDEIRSGDITKIASQTSSLDGRTFSNSDIEAIYKEVLGVKDASDRVFARLPYSLILNYMMNVIEMNISLTTNIQNVTVPTDLIKTSTRGTAAMFAKECVQELTRKFFSILQCLSQKKSKQHVDTEVTYNNLFPLGKFLTMPLSNFPQELHRITRDLDVFKDGSMNTSDSMTITDFSNMISTKQTEERSLEMYNSRVRMYQSMLSGHTVSQVEYRGFYSEKTREPYFFEVFTRTQQQEMVPLAREITVMRNLRNPTTRVIEPTPTKINIMEQLTQRDIYRLVSTSGLTIAYGDMNAGKLEEMNKGVAKIENMLQKFADSIDIAVGSADPDIFMNIIKECQIQNGMLIR